MRGTWSYGSVAQDESGRQAALPGIAADANPLHGMEMVKPRLLILIVAYNSEKNIEDVLVRVPRELSDRCDTEVLVLDDSSADATFDISTRIQQSGRIPFPVRVLFNPINQGYGGNQKLGYHFAIKHRFDYVA